MRKLPSIIIGEFAAQQAGRYKPKQHANLNESSIRRDESSPLHDAMMPAIDRHQPLILL